MLRRSWNADKSPRSIRQLVFNRHVPYSRSPTDFYTRDYHSHKMQISIICFVPRHYKTNRCSNSTLSFKLGLYFSGTQRTKMLILSSVSCFVLVGSWSDTLWSSGLSRCCTPPSTNVPTIYSIIMRGVHVIPKTVMSQLSHETGKIRTLFVLLNASYFCFWCSLRIRRFLPTKAGKIRSV